MPIPRERLNDFDIPQGIQAIALRAAAVDFVWNIIFTCFYIILNSWLDDIFWSAAHLANNIILASQNLM